MVPGAACSSGAAGQARAQDGGASAAFWQVPDLDCPHGGSTGREARGPTRLVSTGSVRMAGVYSAAKDAEWEKVEVRRPLEAVSSTDCGPTRAVRLGLWSVDPGSLRPTPDSPCCAESSPYVRRPSGNFDVASRHSSVKVRTPPSVTRTLACHIAESHNFSPPPSPAIAVSATF